MQDLITLTLLLFIAVVFYSRPELKQLKSVQYWALLKIIIECIYLIIFKKWSADHMNWHFYFFSNISGALLYTFAIRGLVEHFFKKKVKWIYLTTILILSTPFMTFIPYVSRIYLTYAFANFFVIFEAPRAFREKNVYLISFSMVSFLATVLDVLKFLIPSDKALLVFRELDSLSGLVGNIVFLGAALWYPVSRWVYKKLGEIYSGGYLKPVLANGRGYFSGSELQVQNNIYNGLDEDLPTPEERSQGAEIFSFPGRFSATALNPADGYTENIRADLEKMEPVFETAAKMLALSRKPFLDLEDVAEYLSLEKDKALEFINKYKLNRVYLTDSSSDWVIRRIDIDYLLEEERGD